MQILTLVPNSWSLRKAADGFSISKSTIERARLLRHQKGIMEYPDLTKRQKLSQVIIYNIETFIVMISFPDNYLERKVI